MITYFNGSFGVRILGRIHGSALWKSILPAFISTVIYLLMFYCSKYSKKTPNSELLFLHPYPLGALVTAFTFLLVFRANYSYNRWWEAYSSIYLMHSKWLDFSTEVAAFHYQSERYNKYKPPTFGANPGMQSLEVRESANSILTNTYSDDDSIIGIEPKMQPQAKTITEKGAEDIKATPQGLARHAKTPTYTDLIAQMNACEAKEAEMNRQSLEIVESESNYDSSDSEIDQQYSNETSDDVNGKGLRRRQSWIRKKLQRRFSRKRKKHRKANSVSEDFDTVMAGTGNRNLNSVRKSRKQQKERYKQDQKPKRRRTRHLSNRPSATGNASSRIYNHRKSITMPGGSAQQEIQWRDRFDVKTGISYSIFTANSRKHLREGNLDPDSIPPLLFLEECAHLLSLMSAVAFSTLRNDLPEAESPLTVFEPSLPWPLVDPDGYKGRVRKGWTQSKSGSWGALQFLLGRSRNDKARTRYNAARPFRVIGNVSDAEIEKLQEARGPLAKVSLVSMWLLELISREYQAGSTGNVAPPIISRLYQFVSDGLAGYNQARKIACIPFPFPHAQITTLFMLVVDFFVTPLLMVTFVFNPLMGAVLNLFSVLCFTGLHEVAREIEDPFQNVPNDVPLNNYQAQFNEGLMIMFYGYHPDAYWNNRQRNNDDVGNNSNNNSKISNEASLNEVHNNKGENDIGSTSDTGNTQEQEKRSNQPVTFSTPNNNSTNDDEAIPESMPPESLRVPDASNNKVASKNSNSITTDVVQDSCFNVPMGTRMDSASSAGSFRIPLTNNSSEGSFAFQVPNSESDSSAIFETNNSNKEGRE